jgi:hypothetical protein
MTDRDGRQQWLDGAAGVPYRRARVPTSMPAGGWTVRSLGIVALEWVSPSGRTIITEPLVRAWLGAAASGRGGVARG